MLAIAVILFREVLEASLVISIVLAATKGMEARGHWVGYGIILGVAGACVAATFAGVIAGVASGRGQELMNAGILLSAVAMLGWHNIWMSKHGKALARHIKEIGHEVASGRSHLSVIMIVVMMAVLREGSEVVLFTYGVAASGAQALPMTAGGMGGVLAGMLAGVLLYKGLLRIPTRYLFSVTGWMILLLAAGMAADAAGFLTQAGVLPALTGPVWDTSWLLSEQSIVGRLLHILVGYTARPSAMQIIFYGVTVGTIASLTRIVNRPGPPPVAPANAQAEGAGVAE